MLDKVLISIGYTLFALFFGAVVSVGACLASSSMLMKRPPYVGTRVYLVNRGWQRDGHRGGRNKLTFGPKYPA